jgi:hypothetical protein
MQLPRFLQSSAPYSVVVVVLCEPDHDRRVEEELHQVVELEVVFEPVNKGE